MISPTYDAGYARKIADSVVEFFSDCCERIEIAGSLRRKRLRVHDIDLVCIPKTVERKVSTGDLFKPTKWTQANLLAERLQALSEHDRIQVTKRGEKYWRISSPKYSIPIDIYFAGEETFPIIFLIRTGSRAHNIKLIKKAEKLGKKLHAAGRLECPDGDMIIENEGDVFEALDMEFVKPEGRE